jgi:cytochrome c oxidase subunit 3
VSSAHAKAEHNPYLAHHFESIEQQEESCTLGMWLFLAQEVMFFGGLFMAYSVYRYMYFDAWVRGSAQLDQVVGGFNTIILLLSSFTMAMGVYHCQVGNSKKLFRYLSLTMILGLAFVGLKLWLEWGPKISHGVFPGNLWNPDAHHYPDLVSFGEQGHLQIFFFLYYVMTGMHALHMIIGFGILAVLMVMTKMNKFGPKRYMPILFFGLYWHFVDIVWVFLFPMFYLVT